MKLSILQFISGNWVVSEPRPEDNSLHGISSNDSSEQADDDCWDSVPQDANSPLSDGNSESTSSEICLPNQTHSEEPLADIAGKYVLKIKEENRLTQSTMKKVAQATSDLFGVACRRLKRKVEEALNDANIEELPGIDAAFEEVVAPFEQLDAKWMLAEFTRDKLPYVVSTQCISFFFHTHQ